jgi:hypothetical protein
MCQTEVQEPVWPGKFPANQAAQIDPARKNNSPVGAGSKLDFLSEQN